MLRMHRSMTESFEVCNETILVGQMSTYLRDKVLDSIAIGDIVYCCKDIASLWTDQILHIVEKDNQLLFISGGICIASVHGT